MSKKYVMRKSLSVDSSVTLTSGANLQLSISKCFGMPNDKESVGTDQFLVGLQGETAPAADASPMTRAGHHCRKMIEAQVEATSPELVEKIDWDQNIRINALLQHWQDHSVSAPESFE